MGDAPAKNAKRELFTCNNACSRPADTGSQGGVSVGALNDRFIFGLMLAVAVQRPRIDGRMPSSVWWTRTRAIVPYRSLDHSQRIKLTRNVFWPKQLRLPRVIDVKIMDFLELKYA
jgi:hypothetical protein